MARGGPLTAEKFVEHALRQQREYSFEGRPMASISVDLTIGEWTHEVILRRRLWSRSTFAVVSAGMLRACVYHLLPTYSVPHCDIVLPEVTIEAAAGLLALFPPSRTILTPGGDGEPQQPEPKPCHSG